MNIQFPPEFESLINAPSTRAAIVSEITSPNPNHCKNCGGVGSMVIFIATRGPFTSPASGRDVVTKWDNGRWWGGKHYEFDCPVCHSLDKPYQGTETVFERDKRVSEQIAMLTEEWEVK